MKQITLVLAFAASVFTGQVFAADDISAILKQIKAERSGQTAKPAPTPYAPPKQNQQQKKKSTSSSGVSPSAEKPPAPKIPIWNPRDKLPKNFAGIRMAGRFALIGTTHQGYPMLVPAEDVMNPFARQFWVENVSSALGANVTLPIDQRSIVTIPRSNPLVLIKRGVLPGIYWVHLQ